MIESKILEKLDKKSKSYFIQLLKSLNNNEITLYVGAGVSASCGIPTWKKLAQDICTVFFAHWEFTKNQENIPKNLSIGLWEDFFWTNETKSLAERFSQNDPIRTMEQIKSQIEPKNWIWLIRKMLYDQNTITHSELLNSITKLISTKCINTVLTTNYDDLLELRMKSEGQSVKSIAYEPIKNKGVNQIIHLHGILPMKGGQETRIVFTESEYNEEFSKPYSWTNIIQLNKFCEETCIFIGTSFSDINLIKLLRTSRKLTKNMHYAFIFDNPNEDEKSKKLFYNYLYNLGVKTIILPMKSETSFNALPNYLNILNDFIENKEHELRKYVT